MGIFYIVKRGAVDPCAGGGPVLQYIDTKWDNNYFQDGGGDATFTFPESVWSCNWENAGETVDANALLDPFGSWITNFRTENLASGGEIRIYCSADTTDPGTMDVSGESGNPLTVDVLINGTYKSATFQGLGGGSTDRRWYVNDINEGPGDLTEIRFRALNGNPDAGIFWITKIEFWVDFCDQNPGGNWGSGGGG